MTITERIQNLPKLQYLISTGDEAAKEELRDLYKLVLNKEMKRDCTSCRLRAYQELTNLTTAQMSHKKFVLKDPDSPVYFNHQHYIGSTLTDEVGYEMLASNPANAELFSHMPEDAVKVKKADKVEKADKKADKVEVPTPVVPVEEPAKTN